MLHVVNDVSVGLAILLGHSIPGNTGEGLTVERSVEGTRTKDEGDLPEVVRNVPARFAEISGSFLADFPDISRTIPGIAIL